MSSPVAIQAFSQNFLLGAVALSLVLTCRCALRMVLGSHSAWRWTEALIGIAAMALIGILVLDAMQCIDSGPGARLAPLPGLAIFGLALASAWLYARCAAHRLPSSELVAKPAVWLLLAWSISASAWSGYRLYEANQPVLEELDINPQPQITRVQELVAFSDQGREIPLYVVESAPPDWPRGWQPVTAALRRLAQTVILQEGPDGTCNCHGWVFAGGKYLLDGKGVQTILEDNGYQACTDPQPGDVIVYLDSVGFIRHSGLVRGVLTDGTVLVESKWNLQERFLHRPEDQPYSKDYTYYRCIRGSHAVTIQPQEARAEVGSTSSAGSASLERS